MIYVKFGEVYKPGVGIILPSTRNISTNFKFSHRTIRIMFKSIVLICGLVAAASAYRTSSHLAPFGIVEGITDCGSNGKLGTVDVEDCTAVPCTFNPGQIYDIAIRFTAGVTSETLVLQVLRTLDFATIVELPINGVIEAGIEYELKFQLPVSEDFSGTEFGIRFYVLDLDSFRVEVCAEGSVIIS